MAKRRRDVADWYIKKTFVALLDDAAERWESQKSLYYEGRRWSFAEIREEVDAVARGLIALRIEPGDKVTLWMPNRPEWIFAFFALSKIGAGIVPANTRFRAADIGNVVRQSDSGTLVTVDRSGPVDYLDLTREVIPEIMDGPPRGLAHPGVPCARTRRRSRRRALPGDIELRRDDGKGK